MRAITNITINLNALVHNLEYIQSLTTVQEKCIAVIKSDAYGHGALYCAQTLKDKVTGFAVSDVDEALILRQGGISNPIVILRGVLNASELALATELDLEVVVHHEQQLQLLEKTHLKKNIKVWIKVDTGMHRLGFSVVQLDTVFPRIKKLKPVQLVMAMTHLADAYNQDLAYTLEQIQLFKQVMKKFNLTVPTSICNSAGFINFGNQFDDYHRLGIVLYGVSPFGCHENFGKRLIPVMTYKAPIIAINDIEAGDRVGYGLTWMAQHSGRLAIIATGYADGYPYNAMHGTPVLINQKRAYLVGKVSMNLLQVDISHFEPHEIKVGDEAILWGDELLSVSEVAHYANTISYHLLTSIRHIPTTHWFTKSNG